MSRSIVRFALAATSCTVLACAAALPASAQTIARKDLSVDGAVALAVAAMADCKSMWYRSRWSGGTERR